MIVDQLVRHGGAASAEQAVVVPNVVGLSVAQAVPRLALLGLDFSTATSYTADSARVTIVSQDPAEGTKASPALIVIASVIGARALVDMPAGKELRWVDLGE
jgi:beta-lactam-binding protein with PASTA domain